MILSLLLAAAAAEPALPVRAPTSSDEEVWQAASRIDRIAVYQTYLIRFPRGLQAGAAEARIMALGGTRLEALIPSLAGPPPSRPAPGSVKLDACTRALLQQLAPGKREAADIAEFRALRRGNRLDMLRQFVAGRRTSDCWINASRLLDKRLSDGGAVRPVAGFGPFHAQRLSGWRLAYSDYPSSALRANEQGNVVAQWDVAADGAVEDCRVVRSSGSATLDTETCLQITRRLRYDPARDAAGVPLRSTDAMVIGWRIGG